MTELEKQNAIFEVGTGGYITVKKKNVCLHLLESTICTNISQNFLGECLDLNIDLASALFDVNMRNGRLVQFRNHWQSFNLKKLFRLKIIKDIKPNGYWFDNRCYYIPKGFPMQKRVYFEEKQATTNLFSYNSAIANQKIQNFDSDDKVALNKDITEIADLVKAAKKVEKTVGISQEGYFLYDDTNIVKETFTSEIEKKCPL